MNNLSYSNSALATKSAIKTILFVWFAYLALLAILQFLGFHFGYNVWPLKEDRNFLGFMLNAKGPKIAHEFWNMNDRNPLCVWWWITFSWAIKHFDAGLYIIRKCLDPFLAISTFLLLDRLGRGESKFYALSTALLVLTWNFSSYYEQIIWPFLGALGLSLLSIYFFCCYVDSDRKNSRALAISLLLYLFCIGTYTLQSGAVLAVIFLSFFRQVEGVVENFHWQERIKKTLWDGGFFAAIFIIYNCISYTASRNVDVFYVFDWSIFAKQFLSSLKQFVFHPSYLSFWTLSRNDFSALGVWLILLAGFSAYYLVLKSYTKKVSLDLLSFPLNWVLVVMLAVILPTVVVESTSTIWYPGSRSLMVQQVWQPLLYVSIVFGLMNILFSIFKQFCEQLLLVFISLLGAFSILYGLDYNHHLVLRTYYQRNLALGILKLNIPIADAPNYLVKITDKDNQDMNSISVLISSYGQTMMHQPVSMRVISTTPSPAFEPYWRTRFEPDNQGVFNAGPIGDVKAIPYNHLWVLFYDGKKVWVPARLDKCDFEGWQVDWNRSESLDQTQKIRQLKK